MGKRSKTRFYKYCRYGHIQHNTRNIEFLPTPHFGEPPHDRLIADWTGDTGTEQRDSTIRVISQRSRRQNQSCRERNWRWYQKAARRTRQATERGREVQKRRTAAETVWGGTQEAWVGDRTCQCASRKHRELRFPGDTAAGQPGQRQDSGDEHQARLWDGEAAARNTRAREAA